MFEELSILKVDREKGLSYIKEIVNQSSTMTVPRIGPLIQKLKKTVTSLCPSDCRIRILQEVKTL